MGKSPRRENESKVPSTSHQTDVLGGINLTANRVTIHGDAIAGDKVVVKSTVAGVQRPRRRKPRRRKRMILPKASAWKKGVFEIPIIGRIYAGPFGPIVNELLEGEYESIVVSSNIVAFEEGLFALRVQGNSMDSFVHDDDLVVLRKQSGFDNGDRVYVRLDGIDQMCTLKQIYREPDGRIRLQPENPLYHPIYVDPRKVDVKVQGKVVKVVRSNI